MLLIIQSPCSLNGVYVCLFFCNVSTIILITYGRPTLIIDLLVKILVESIESKGRFTKSSSENEYKLQCVFHNNEHSMSCWGSLVVGVFYLKPHYI